MRTQIRYSLAPSIVFAILLSSFKPVAGQYRNPYNGVSHSSQLAKFYDMTRTWNSNLFDAMSRYQATKDRLKELARANGGSSRATTPRATPQAYSSNNPAARSAPAIRQYPITATDFKPIAARIVPDQFANSIPGLSLEQREALRALSNQFLTAFEGEARKNNIANAMALLIAMSLQVLTEKEVSDDESKQMIVALNNALGATPQFASMTPQDKQIVYESAIVMGGIIATLNIQGAQQNDLAMRSQAREISRAVVKNLLGIEAQ
jgi:uncharacterized protein DUF6683